MGSGPRLVVLLTLATGCSAVINPDIDRLGDGVDAGPGFDAGPDFDAGPGDDAGPDFDAGPGFDAGPDFDAGPTCPESCDDSIPCTDDGCVDGTCRSEPDDAACGSGQRCDPRLGCVATVCTRDAECDDGLFCNGVERCDPGVGCAAGPPPCDDGYACTSDTCDEGADACASTPNDALCETPGAPRCVEERCDPGASAEPSGCVATPNDALCDTRFCRVGQVCDLTRGCSDGTPRDCSDGSVCTADACDESGRTCVNTPLDVDMDGYAARLVLDDTGALVICEGATDCDDGNPDVRPGLPELCNGFDDNCNDMVDEGCSGLPDDCGSAEQIVISGGVGSAAGTFAPLRDDFQTNPICRASPGGRDAVYFFDIPRGTYDVTIDTTGSAADTVLGVGFSCDATGLGAVCNDDRDGAGSASRIWIHRVGSGTSSTRVYVLVDGFRSSTAGAYVVNVTLERAAADRCPTVSGAPIDISGGGTLVGFSSEFFGSYSGTCTGGGPFNDPEAVLQFHGPPSGRVSFGAYSTDFTPDLYLRVGCSSGTEIACAPGAALGGGVNGALLASGVMPGETHTLFVDGGRGVYAVYYTPR